MIDTVPRPDANLAALLKARAQHASDTTLVVDAIAGMGLATLATYWGGPAWNLLLCTGLCVGCFGVWGVVDRELGDRPQAAPAIRVTLRTLRAASAITGFAAGALLALIALGYTLGRMIS